MIFWKIHGLGNDYVVIDNRDDKITDKEAPALAKKLCERRFSVGADGLLLACASSQADVRMRIFNADGSEAEMCGNGVRCFAKFCYETAIVKKNEFSVETNAGIRRVWLTIKDNEVSLAKVDMVLKTCEPTDNTEAAKISAAIVNEFIDKTHKLWDNHPVNIKRAAEGKLKANVVLTRDAGHLLPRFFSMNERYHVDFACLADMHAERGIAQLAGMDSKLLPPPSGNLQKDCEIRVKALLDILPKHDCFYIHLKGPDEPGHDGNCTLKTQIISAIDKYFFGPLLKQISLKDNLICITTDHATPCSLKVHSDTPVPVLISGDNVKGKNGGKAVKFSEKDCANGSLGTIERGCELMPKLMDILKK